MGSDRLRLAAAVSLAAALALLPGVSSAGGGSIFVKGGVMRLSDSHQVFEEPLHIPVNVTLVRDSDRTGGVGWEMRMRYGLAVGAEFLGYRNEFGPVGSPAAGEAKTSAFLAGGKKYFFDSGVFHPYVGGGFGLGHTDIDHTDSATRIDDINLSFLLHAVVGMEMRVDSVNFMLEARRLYFFIDKGEVEYDPSSIGAFFGVGVYW